MPRIIGETLEDHRKKTRQQLFDALSRLLQTSTFESLTMAKIAQEAGVGRTAVYNHFQDKEALLLAFIAYETGQYSVRLNRALAGVSSPIKMLRIYIREQLTLGSSYHLAPGLDLRRQVSNETSSELRLHAQIVKTYYGKSYGKPLMRARFLPKPTHSNLDGECLFSGQVSAERPHSTGISDPLYTGVCIAFLGSEPHLSSVTERKTFLGTAYRPRRKSFFFSRGRGDGGLRLSDPSCQLDTVFC